VTVLRRTLETNGLPATRGAGSKPDVAATDDGQKGTSALDAGPSARAPSKPAMRQGRQLTATEPRARDRWSSTVSSTASAIARHPGWPAPALVWTPGPCVVQRDVNRVFIGAACRWTIIAIGT